MKTVIGIDNGTQSTKVMFYDFENKKIAAMAQAPHEIISRSDGSMEQKAEWWIEALKTCFDSVAPEIKKTAVAAGVSGQQHGFVPVDCNGDVLIDVKLWCDTSTVEECREIERKCGGADILIKDSGNRILPGYTASKILWFKKNQPALYKKMKHILLPHDYLNFYLTGEFSMEYGDASGTALLNIKKREWNLKILEAIDPEKKLGKCLPDLINAYDFSGFVTEQTASELGIIPGIPVSAGGGDNMMGAIGTGSVSPGIITMSLGTSGTIYGYSDNPVIDTKGNLAAFCSSSGGWLPLLCTMNCTVATEMVRKLFGMDIPAINKAAASAKPGCGGIITLPFFNGERTPNLPKGKGCIVGIDSNNFNCKNIIRSSFESAILGMKLGLDSFIDLGFEPEEIRLTGGGAKSPLWRQIASDILELPVVVPEQEEAAAFGAALQALWALKRNENENISIEDIVTNHVTFDKSKILYPVKKNSTVYKGIFSEYMKYIESLSDIFV